MAQDEKQRELCLRVLQTCRAELCDLFPYLDAAFDCLRWQLGDRPGFSVDGQAMYFPVRETLECYSREPAALRRGYLHMLLHCLFLHLFRPAGEMWSLACDMAVEQMIERQAQPRLARENAVRKDCFDRMGNEPLSAERILELLAAGTFPYTMEEIRGAFSFDDHSRWDESTTGGLRSQWEQMLLAAAKNKAGKGKRGTTSGAAAESPLERAESKYDYRKFLQRFTFPREEVELDTESFDYNFYNFGMEQYGSMPLIEPLEYKEVRRLEELVIAIDTSGSCSRETVSRFLSETYAILSRQENFFRRMKVYFIQCDCLIQDVALIRNREDWLAYEKKICIRGRGGTDFTPVFDYVEKQRQRKELKNLKALLYFTDGDGAYPTTPPDYETAFILLKESGRRELVPAWGKLLLIQGKSMNIQEAKQEIIHTLQAYLRKDEAGNYLFPAVHQRPILLMGPPGIGKTAIMEQVARSCGVGLVAYTITHHTRQSAIGLPHIEEKTYGGQVMSVTEYTMSEIIASVYETMERTGCREGILFLDEINCVSETLAPTMLQFLQNKTFGTHRVPEGWVIVAAGNPPEYNKSVREFDVVTLDRVRQIDVEADLDIWLDYARQRQLHGAVISYLSVKRERFYMVKRTEDNLSFVTARGWEDLSQILKGYEALGVPVTEALVSQFLHHGETARDFAAYYRLYQTYGADYAVPEILNGTLAEKAYQERVAMAQSGSFDERITVVNLVLDALGAEFAAYAREDAAVVRLHELLGRYQNGSQSLTEFIAANRKSLEVKRQNALLSPEEARREERVLHRLEEMDLAVKQAHIREQKEQLALLRTLFGEDVRRREELIRRTQTELSHGFRFVADCFGEGQEMILLASALTRTPNALTYIGRHGCEPYLHYAQALMYRQQEAALRQACREVL